ncbi:MAG: dihydroneopterin aldolase [Chloroflexi bacterium]|nr:dihydroneopterin aldolase [Chloroflexota bacterium]
MSPDRIVLNGLQFYGFHGVNPEERSLGQQFVVDLQAELDLSVPAASDRLEDTVSYADLYRAVKAVMEGEPRNLLESAAGAIVSRVLGEHPQIDAVRVRVHKPRPPIKGSVIEAAAVEIYRSRSV